MDVGIGRLVEALTEEVHHAAHDGAARLSPDRLEGKAEVHDPLAPIGELDCGRAALATFVAQRRDAAVQRCQAVGVVRVVLTRPVEPEAAQSVEDGAGDRRDLVRASVVPGEARPQVGAVEGRVAPFVVQVPGELRATDEECPTAIKVGRQSRSLGIIERDIHRRFLAQHPVNNLVASEGQGPFGNGLVGGAVEGVVDGVAVGHDVIVAVHPVEEYAQVEALDRINFLDQGEAVEAVKAIDDEHTG